MTAARSVVRPLVRPLVQQLTGGVVDQVISAVIKPTMSPLYHGNALQDVANWETFGEDTNYVPLPGRTIGSVVRAYLGDAVDASTALSAGDTAGFNITVTDSEGDVVVFTAFPITVQDVAPAVDAAPSASGDVYEDGNLTGTSGTFTGTNLVEIDEWEVSDDGSTDWTGTGDTDTTSPALVLGKYYRFASTAANSAGTVTSYSNVLGTVVAAPAAAVITINSIGLQTPSGNVPVDYTIDKNDSGVQVLLALAGTAKPGAALFGADSGTDPSDGAGSGYLDAGTVAMTIGGASINGAIPDGLISASYQLWYLPTGGNDSDVVGSGAVAIDTTPADLDTPTATGGSTVIDWTFTPDKDSAAVLGWRVSYFPGGTDPDDAAIAAGTGATGTVTGTATASVEESGQFTGVTAGTYQLTIYFKDAFGNESFETLADVTVTAPSNAMGDDTGVIYHFGYDDTTRSGTDVTAMNDKGGNAFALTSIGAFSAPQQADASSAIVFDGANPDVIQTATADAAQNLLVDHLTTGAGSVRMFMVIDADSLGTSPGAFFAESANNGDNQSFYFGALKNGSGNIQFWCRARRFSDAYDAGPSTSVPASGAGLVLLELDITQSAWTAYLNGATVGTGAVTAGNLPNPSSTWVSIGARASNTSANLVATGGFREMFLTGTRDIETLDAIRTQLATKYAISI